LPGKSDKNRDAGGDQSEAGQPDAADPVAEKRPAEPDADRGHDPRIERAGDRSRSGLQGQRDHQHIGRAEADDHHQHRQGPAAHQVETAGRRQRREEYRGHREAQRRQIIDGQGRGHAETGQHKRTRPDGDRHRRPEQASQAAFRRLDHSGLLSGPGGN